MDAFRESDGWLDHHPEPDRKDVGDDDRESCVSALTMGTWRKPNLVMHHTGYDASREGNDEKQVAQNPTLFGRQEELSILLSAYSRIAAQKGTSEVVLLHGPGGCGKTCLAESLRGPISRQGGYFVTGKFDSCSKLPYPALVEALTDLCDLIVQRKGFGRAQQIKILEKIGVGDTQRLGLLLGNLHRVVGNIVLNTSFIDDADEDDGVSTAALSRHALLLFSLLKFLRATSSPKHPICIFLDDLQLADEQSLQLLQGLASDPISRNVLFVLVYRSSDDDATNTKPKLDLLKQSKRVKVTDIKLGNLDIDALNQLLANHLKAHPTYTMPLAEVVWRKTHGHPYCVLQYLQVLRRDELISKTPGGDWVWDIAQIQCETDVTDNVANIITDRIRRCHKYVQLILKVASAIGGEFDCKLLENVVMIECVAASARKSNSAIKDVAKKVNKCLNIALKDGLIEKTGYTGKLKFSHERVREGVYSLIPEGRSRQDLHYSIGVCVKQMLLSYQNSQPPTWMVYAAAEQLNRAGRWNDPVEHVCLNLLAARYAQTVGAFVPAAEFLRSAQGVIAEQALFSKHYDLGRELYTEMAEVEYALGDFVRSEAAARLVFRYAKCPEDKMGTFRMLVDSMDAQGNGLESIEIALGVLQEFGEDFPSAPKAVNVIMELIKTQELFQSMTDEELINLPLITDQRKLNILNVIAVFGTMTPLAGCELIALQSTLRIVQRCLQDGVAHISTHAFASLGTAMAMSGHPNEAYRIGNVALALLERLDSPSSIQAHTKALVHGACRHWKQPFKDSLQPLKEAYEKSVAVGDIKFSFLAAQSYLVGSLESGVALSQVEVDMRTFCEGLDDMSLNKNSAFRTMIVPVWQQVLNFMGTSENPLFLTGAAMDEEQFMLDPNTKKFAGGMLAYAKAKLMLAYHFDDLAGAEILAEELGKDDRMVIYHFTVYQLKMICCLTHLHLFELNGQRKHHIKALQIIQKMEAWMQEGNLNCRPILLLLHAEEAALKSHGQRVFKHEFDVAILEASTSGLTHVEALAAERAAVACFRAGEFGDGVVYVLHAHGAYTRWGAHAKADHLERKFHVAFESVSSKTESSARLSIDSINVRVTP
ncbi:histidine kinase [Fragilaria crotonensis]|nr:histidine kinase [Fragilaria crotonensis]